MPLGCSRLLAVVLLRFQRVAEDITGGLDAFCVGVGVHFERDAFIGMTEFFGNRSNIRVVRDGDTGECVAQLMRMKMIDAVEDVFHGNLQQKKHTVRCRHGSVQFAVAAEDRPHHR